MVEAEGGRGADQRAELERVMAESRLTRARVAELCGVAPSTVDSWLGPPGRPWARAVKWRHLHLLRLSLKAQGNNGKGGA